MSGTKLVAGADASDLLEISSVVFNFHIGLFAGTHLIVRATPQNFIPGHSGLISGDISVRSK
jgi:hypothetical protein